MARTRRLRTLLALWAAYWAGLAAVEVGPVLWEYLRIQATSGHGTVSWSFTGSPTALSLALFGPPLVLWALWLLVPERGRAAGEEAPAVLREGEQELPPLHRRAPFRRAAPERNAPVPRPIDEEPPRR